MTTQLTIYTMDGCGHCNAAKALLEYKEVPHKQVHVPIDMTTAEFVNNFPGVRNFPCILAEDGSYIGALKELQLYLLSKELGGMTI